MLCLEDVASHSKNDYFETAFIVIVYAHNKIPESLKMILFFFLFLFLLEHSFIYDLKIKFKSYKCHNVAIQVWFFLNLISFRANIYTGVSFPWMHL